MPGGNGAPRLLGRDRERAQLYAALMTALEGSPQTVVMGGDAGIGKTTLVSDAARRAQELGFSVAVGHGLDIEAGISFAPVIEAVGSLVAQAGDLVSRPCARRMRAVLNPEAATGPEPFRVLEELRQTVLEAAVSGPVMLVLEDMHWADRSTLDVAVALSRTARGRLLLLLTARSEDLHRHHPARRTLAEIGRLPGARHVDLGPLDRDGIAGIVTSCSGSADPELIGSVLERSQGNPLYAEEIVAAGREALPGHLSDLFLARVDALAVGPRELIRLASVDGTRIDTEALAALAGLDQVQLEDSLRQLRDANLLKRSGASLVFRHPLLREAVYDDLLPDERTRLHGELAVILETRIDAEPDAGSSLLSRLAFHWSAANNLPRALRASERAGMAAWKVGAAESVTHLERALALWDAVPDGESVVGRTRVELIVSLARSVCDQGDAERWYALNRQAVSLLTPGADPLVASRANSALGFSAIFNDELTSAQEAILRAVEYAGDCPTEERAYALGAQALSLNFTGRFAAGLQAADRAIEAARSAACIDPLLLAMGFRCDALRYLGRVRESTAYEEQAIDVARAAGMVGQALDLSGHLASGLLQEGEVARALAVARSGHREGVARGLPVAAAFCGDAMVTALTWSGRLESAELLLMELRDLGLPTDPWWRLAEELALARGDMEAAVRAVPESTTNLDDLDLLRELRLAVGRNDLPARLEGALSYLARLEDWESPLLAASAARIGFHAVAIGASPLGSRAAELRASAARQLERARSGLTEEWCTTYFGVQLALAEGYAARVAGQDATAEFRSAAGLALPFGEFFALEPRLDLAQELLAHGGRDEGRELLVTCWTVAHDMGAGALERRASRLAQRARVPLPEAATHGGPLSRLTPREREVLDQLAIGATNKVIARDLFISEKTVSVHVSNVLTKLGVANRGAAAAVARDLVG